MNKPTFKHICLMHIQQLTNFPYIEKDFDALTDYGLLCKVVDYLNQVIKNENAQNENIVALYNAFTELKNYVENYFDNLDVQDEINNKLDDMIEDGTLDQIIEQYLNSSAIWGFDTVADMKNATNLINGSFARTLGYYESNDGGRGTYKIRNKTESDIPDEFLLIEIGSTLVGELIIENKEVNVKQAGCYGDDTHDDTINLQKAFSSNYNVFIPAGTYIVSEPLTMPFNKFIIGENRKNTKLKGTIENDYIIKYGTSYNYNGYDGAIKNIEFITSLSINKSKGIYLYSSALLENLGFYGIGTAINRINNYLDLITLRNIYCGYCVPSNNEYIINLAGNQDALIIEQLKFESYSENNTPYNGIHISTSHGGSINNSILNCNITINRTNGFSINNSHMELLDKVINIKDSEIEINNLFKWKNNTLNDIKLEISDYGSNNTINLNNIMFARNNANYNYVASKEINELPINTTLHIKDCYRLINFADVNSYMNVLYGIEIENNEEFNNLSGIYSKSSEVITGKDINKLINITKISPTTLGTPAKNNNVKWLSDSAVNLYYRATVICDETRKIITGYSNSAIISDVVQNGGGIYIPVNNNNYNKDIYLYRGNNIDEYTKRVKISLPNRGRIIDTGLQCCMKEWETVEQTNGRTGYNNVDKFEKYGDNVIVYNSSTPSYGTWKKYDKVINTNTSSGQAISWIYDGTNWIAQGEY